MKIANMNLTEDLHENDIKNEWTKLEKKANDTRYIYGKVRQSMENDLDLQIKKKCEAKTRSGDIDPKKQEAYKQKLAEEEIFRKEKYLQIVKNRNPQYRKFEAQIREAYATKALVEQIREKESRRLTEAEAEDRQRHGQIVDHELSLREEKEKRMRQEREKHLKYRADLDEQIALNKAFTAIHDTSSSDQFMVQQIIDKMSCEDQMSHNELLEKRKKLQEDIEEAERRRHNALVNELERQRLEDAQIASYEQRKLAEEAKLKEVVHPREYAKQKVLCKFIENLELKEKKESERTLLWEEGGKLRSLENQKMRTEREKQKIREACHALNDSYQSYLRCKEEKLVKLKELEQIAELKDKAYLEELERRRDLESVKKNAWKEEVKQCARSHEEERRKREEEIRQHLLAREVIASKEDANEFQVLEEERMRMLKKHAPALLGFLPKGFIRDKKELDLLEEESKIFILDKKIQEC